MLISKHQLYGNTEENKRNCSEQPLQHRTTQSSNRKGKVPTTRARIRNLSTRLSLFRTWAMVVKLSVALVVKASFHCFFRL
jgi:hypothetical protein